MKGSTSKHGISLQTLLRRSADLSNPCLLVSISQIQNILVLLFHFSWKVSAYWESYGIICDTLRLVLHKFYELLFCLSDCWRHARCYLWWSDGWSDKDHIQKKISSKSVQPYQEFFPCYNYYVCFHYFLNVRILTLIMCCMWIGFKPNICLHYNIWGAKALQSNWYGFQQWIFPV